MNQMSIPATEPNDSDDVTLALETAEALWNKGDPNEALRWLRRAAEAAGDSGNDMRAVVLAKAVAELNAVGPEQAAPKPVRPPPLPPQTPVTKTDAPPADSGSDLLSAKGGPKGVSKAPPPPPSARKSLPPKPPSPPSITRASQAPAEKESMPEAAVETKSAATQKNLNPPPTPPGKTQAKVKSETPKKAVVTEVPKEEPKAVEAAAVEPPQTPEAAHDEVDEVPTSKASAAVSRSLSPPSTKAVTNKSQAASPSRAPAPQAAAPTKASVPSASTKKRNFARAALRVYVTTKDQDGDRLEVHVLNDGQRAPMGAVEALLVPLKRGSKVLK